MASVKGGDTRLSNWKGWMHGRHVLAACCGVDLAAPGFQRLDAFRGQVQAEELRAACRGLSRRLLEAEGISAGDLFKVFWRDLVDAAHPTVYLADQVDWRQFDEALASVFADDQGEPSVDVRLVVGLMHLRYAYDLSDGDVGAAWTENPYWQYFTSGTLIGHRPPIDSSSLTNWHKRIGATGAAGPCDARHPWQDSAEVLQEYQGRLDRIEHIRAQPRHDPQNVYSVHAPGVECIIKGKAHKPCAFGMEIGLVRTSKGNWFMGEQTFPENPYDGHTLKESLAEAERLMGAIPEKACCDLGCRKNGCEGPCDIQVVNRFRKRLPRALKKWGKRRSAIEPVIGHVKSDCRGNRNRLKGTVGDQINAILAASANNFRKLLKSLALLSRLWLKAFRFVPARMLQAACVALRPKQAFSAATH